MEAIGIFAPNVCTRIGMLYLVLKPNRLQKTLNQWKLSI
jgi:hypothetical protein